MASRGGTNRIDGAVGAYPRDYKPIGYGVNCERGDYVPHGFRSSFRDWAGEVSSYPSDVAEMALAHTIKNMDWRFVVGSVHRSSGELQHKAGIETITGVPRPACPDSRRRYPGLLVENLSAPLLNLVPAAVVAGVSAPCPRW